MLPRYFSRLRNRNRNSDVAVPRYSGIALLLCRFQELLPGTLTGHSHQGHNKLNILTLIKIPLITSVLLLTGCIDGFEKHLQDAISLYGERKEQYSEQTNGATDVLFERLILTETLLLPVAKTYDARAYPFTEQGIAIIQNDFVAMDDNRGFDYPLPAAAELSAELEQQAQDIIQSLFTIDGQDAFAVSDTVNSVLRSIAAFEHRHNVYLPMSKHLIESLGYGALHSLYYRCDSDNKTYRLGQDLMALQLLAIKIGNPLDYDRAANIFHQQRVGVLLNDLPHIPFLQEYDQYIMNDKDRLQHCLQAF